MIVLDTHIWIWWVSGDNKLKSKYLAAINAASQVYISSISCWEIAKLVEVNRLTLSVDVLVWLQTALVYPKVQLTALTPEIVVESTRLPGSFHKDPADQLIVATARILNCPVLTEDAKILGYSHVQTI
ncbi:MAG: type II toxin-antitoxin system VapC family toxin [Bacteroidetes bacterium]|nr:type II toxin-antitoxin system VapC family toxin [Bacteroidota bacterium]